MKHRWSLSARPAATPYPASANRTVAGRDGPPGRPQPSLHTLFQKSNLLGQSPLLTGRNRPLRLAYGISTAKIPRRGQLEVGQSVTAEPFATVAGSSRSVSGFARPGGLQVISQESMVGNRVGVSLSRTKQLRDGGIPIDIGKSPRLAALTVPIHARSAGIRPISSNEPGCGLGGPRPSSLYHQQVLDSAIVDG